MPSALVPVKPDPDTRRRERHAVSGIRRWRLGVALLVAGDPLRSDAQRASARALFFGSITYLPLIWVAMIADKL